MEMNEKYMFRKKAYEYGDVRTQNQEVQKEINILRDDGRQLKNLREEMEEFLNSMVIAQKDPDKKKRTLERPKKKLDTRTVEDLMHLYI
jgi:hypothetical protein